jgi:phage antirepressor YoqD-like protein
MKPRSEFMEMVFNTESLIDIWSRKNTKSTIRKEYFVFSAKRKRSVKNRNEPMQQYISKGYFEVKRNLP